MFWKLVDKPGFLDSLLTTLRKALHALGAQIQETEANPNGFKNLSLPDLANSFLASHEAESGEDASAASALKKKPHLKAIALSAIFALLTAYFGFTAYKMALGSSKKAPVSDSLTNRIDLQLEKLEICAGDLLDVWSSASENVKSAFGYYFIPRSLEEAAGASSQALNPIKKLIKDLARATPKAKMGNEEAKKEHLRTLQFAASLCDATRQRIMGLNILGTNRDIPALILGRKEGAVQFSQGRDFTFSDLLKMLSASGILYRPPTQPSDHPLPRRLVLEFAGLMQMAQTEMDSNRFVREQFGEYLQEYGLNLKTVTPKDLERLLSFQMPGDSTPFDVKEFFGFLHELYTSTAPKYAQERYLDSLARKWTEVSLEQTIRNFKEEHGTRLLDDHRLKQERLYQAKRKGHLPLTHTFALSTFLI